MSPACIWINTVLNGFPAKPLVKHLVTAIDILFINFTVCYIQNTASSQLHHCHDMSIKSKIKSIYNFYIKQMNRNYIPSIISKTNKQEYTYHYMMKQIGWLLQLLEHYEHVDTEPLW